MESMRLLTVFLAAATALASRPVAADVIPHGLFSDHAVLQHGAELPVWGTADDGEPVVVEFAGQSVGAVAVDGRWSVRLDPVAAGGPHEMLIRGRNNVVRLRDIFVGEVWICSGQSNMERHLGLQGGQKPIVGWEDEVAAASHPQIRWFHVPNRIAGEPQSDVRSEWVVCSPDTVEDFTAVGYFFGRDVHSSTGMAVGLIDSTWGGTPAEAWTSAATVRRFPRHFDAVKRLEAVAEHPAGALQRHRAEIGRWFESNDPGSSPQGGWQDRKLDMTDWTDMRLPGLWEERGHPDFDGVGWLRRELFLGPEWDGAAAVLLVGLVDDDDWTWVNGVMVGETRGYNEPRAYLVPEGVFRAGRNVVAVRVLDTGGGGGIYGDPDFMLVRRVDAAPHEKSVRLAGKWKFRRGVALADAPPLPASSIADSNTPSVLFNGMIAPLIPYAIRGVIWYQGEANAGHTREYRSLFPAMIGDWRQHWSQGDFPFLFVQIAPYRGMPPELREAQLLALDRVPNTGMAVTIDVGDADDIHPAEKQPVGQRLALAARALVYGEVVQYSGPVFSTMTVRGDEAVLRFAHVGEGLMSRRDTLSGFEVAGADGVFHPAAARIDGHVVVATSAAVSEPAAVRYAWSNVPEASLFNKAGLPASPFRTVVD